MFTNVCLCGVLLVSQVGVSKIAVPVDCTGRPDMSALQRTNTAGGRSNYSPSRARHAELASQRSANTSKTMTTNNFYATTQYLLPPTSNYDIIYSTMRFAGPLHEPNASAAQPIRMPIPPVSLITMGTAGHLMTGKTPATIGGGAMGSVVEKPFANFNSPVVGGLGGIHYSVNPYGINWTWEHDTYRLIDVPSGRVVKEWDAGTAINLRYGVNGHLRLGSQDYFINNNGR